MLSACYIVLLHTISFAASQQFAGGQLNNRLSSIYFPSVDIHGLRPSKNSVNNQLLNTNFGRNKVSSNINGAKTFNRHNGNRATNSFDQRISPSIRTTPSQDVIGNELQRLRNLQMLRRLLSLQSPTTGQFLADQRSVQTQVPSVSHLQAQGRIQNLQAQLLRQLIALRRIQSQLDQPAGQFQAQGRIQNLQGQAVGQFLAQKRIQSPLSQPVGKLQGQRRLQNVQAPSARQLQAQGMIQNLPSQSLGQLLTQRRIQNILSQPMRQLQAQRKIQSVQDPPGIQLLNKKSVQDSQGQLSGQFPSQERLHELQGLQSQTTQQNLGVSNGQPETFVGEIVDVPSIVANVPAEVLREISGTFIEILLKSFQREGFFDIISEAGGLGGIAKALRGEPNETFIRPLQPVRMPRTERQQRLLEQQLSLQRQINQQQRLQQQ